MSTYYTLDQFGFMSVTGVDAVSFMQGYTTCNLETLAPGHFQMGAVCNLKGRMISSFLVVLQGHDLLFRMHRSQVQPTIAFLSKYIVFSKASLEDRSETLVCYGSLDHESEVGTSVVKDETILTTLNNRSEVWTKTPPDGDVTGDATPYIDAEIEAGVAWVDAQSSEQYLPQMFAYHERDAIDFTKGCYLGQEIVARAQYRGELKRRLHHLPAAVDVQTFDGGAIVSTGSQASLAVINNSSNDPVSVDVNGQSLTATPC